MTDATWRVLYYEHGLWLLYAECGTHAEAQEAKVRAINEGKQGVHIEHHRYRADLDG